MEQTAASLAALLIVTVVAWRVELVSSRKLGVLLRAYAYAAALSGAGLGVVLAGGALIMGPDAIEDTMVFVGAIAMGLAMLAGAVLTLRGWGPGLLLSIGAQFGLFAYQSSVADLSVGDALLLLIPVAILIRSGNRLDWTLRPGRTSPST